MNALQTKIDWKKLDWKRLAAIATIGVLLGLAIAIWHAGNEDLPQQNGAQTIVNGQAEGRRAQFASWTFTYDKATTLGDGITQEIEGIRDGVYYKDGKPFIRMRADRVIYNSVTRDFSVSGPVHFDIDDKGKIRTVDTRAATWSDATQTLRIPGKVTVGSENGSRLLVTDITVNLQTGEYKVGKIEGGATP